MENEHSRRNFIKNSGLVTSGLLTTAFATNAQSPNSPSQPPAESRAARFRVLMSREAPLIMPVIPDVLVGRLCEMEGFEALFIGGSWASYARLGIPDFGLISVTELIDWTANIADHTTAPLLADGDDGGGSPINVYRATKGFEKAGAAAVLYEDTVQAKHLDSPTDLVSTAQMVDKIKAAVDARVDPNFVLLIGTNALSEGRSMSEALDRGAAYVEAGADALYFRGMRVEDHPKAYEVMKRPLMNYIGPNLTPADAQKAKIGLIFYHIETIGTGAIHRALKELKNTGKMENAEKMALSEELNAKLVDSERYMALGRKYHLTR